MIKFHRYIIWNDKWNDVQEPIEIFNEKYLLNYHRVLYIGNTKRHKDTKGYIGIKNFQKDRQRDNHSVSFI